MDKKELQEQISLKGHQVLEKIKEVIAEGNARQITIKDDKGKNLVKIPLTVGAVGVACAPVLAGIGAMAALLNNCTIEVVRKGGKKK